MLDNWIGLAPEKTYKLSEESGREEISRLFKFYETDLSTLPPEVEGAADQVLSRLLSAIREGKIELADNDKTGDLEIIQHLKNGDTLKYRSLQGKDKTRLENAADPIRKMYLLAGILCGLGEDVITKLPAPDLRVAEAVSTFLLIMA
jgi:hypothetical protein